MQVCAGELNVLLHGHRVNSCPVTFWDRLAVRLCLEFTSSTIAVDGEQSLRIRRMIGRLLQSKRSPGRRRRLPTVSNGCEAFGVVEFSWVVALVVAPSSVTGSARPSVRREAVYNVQPCASLDAKFFGKSCGRIRVGSRSHKSVARNSGCRSFSACARRLPGTVRVGDVETMPTSSRA